MLATTLISWHDPGGPLSNSVGKSSGLLFGLLLAPISIFALSAPANALVDCTGNSTLGSAATGSGADCGTLKVGQTFQLNVTDFFQSLGQAAFDATQFGVGIVTSGASTLSFSNVQAIVTGVISGVTVTHAPIAIWNATPDNPFGSALGSSFSYSVADPAGSAGAARTLGFTFGDSGVGGFGSGKVSPASIGLTSVTSFVLRGTLDSVGGSGNIISFGVGPDGIPTPGSTFGGYFTTQVPGPLPLAGAAAAFAWSRTLRRRMNVGASC